MPGSVGDSGNFCHCLHLGLSCRAQLVLLTFFFLQVVVTHRTQCLIRFASRVPKTRPNNSHSTLRVAGIPGQQPGASHRPYAAMGNKSRFKYCQYRGACTPSRKLVGMPGTQPVDGSELGRAVHDRCSCSKGLGQSLGGNIDRLGKRSSISGPEVCFELQVRHFEGETRRYTTLGRPTNRLQGCSSRSPLNEMRPSGLPPASNNRSETQDVAHIVSSVAGPRSS